MMDSQTTAKMIRDSAHILRDRPQHTRLVFKRPQTYTINLVNHLGEIIKTNHTYNKGLEFEVLGDGDLYRAMSDPRMTMREFFDQLKDKVAAHLFDISLTQTIVNVEWYVNGNTAGVTIWFNDSVDGQTNIDASVVEAILSIVESKYGHWQAVIDNICSTRQRIF